MTSAISPTYNLPGFGLIKPRLFGCAESVYRFLAQYGHLRRLSEINQLGALREVLPGAHHTRYEYMIAQLGIITELCFLKGHQPFGFQLSSRRNTFGRLPGMAKDPTNGEILQIFALLSNFAHLPSTFSGERALLYRFRTNSDARRTFRRGLSLEDREGFDQLLEEFYIYGLNYYIGLFLLNRYRRKSEGHEYADFCQAILRSYLNTSEDSSDQGLVALWWLYRSIRRLTYLALDSLYTPVPFSLDLASIFLSLEHYLQDVFAYHSGFQEALGKLEGVMRDTVYLAPRSLLQHAIATEAALDQMDRDPSCFGSINELAHVLGPTPKNTQVFVCSGNLVKPDDATRIIVLSYECERAQADRLLTDTVAWETEARRHVGSRSCRFGAEWDPPRTHLRIAASVSSTLHRPDDAATAFKVARELTQFELTAHQVLSASPLDEWRGGRIILEFLMRAAFGWDRLYRFRPLALLDHAPIFLGTGARNTATRVKEYLKKATASELTDADGLNEIRMLQETLQQVSFRGLLVAYSGSTEVISEGKQLAEFDGVIFLLGRPLAEGAVILVEAKNTSNGHTLARHQLQNRLNRLGLTTSDYTLHDLQRKGAFATVSL